MTKWRIERGIDGEEVAVTGGIPDAPPEVQIPVLRVSESDLNIWSRETGQLDYIWLAISLGSYMVCVCTMILTMNLVKKIDPPPTLLMDLVVVIVLSASLTFYWYVGFTLIGKRKRGRLEKSFADKYGANVDFSKAGTEDDLSRDRDVSLLLMTKSVSD